MQVDIITDPDALKTIRDYLPIVFMIVAAAVIAYLFKQNNKLSLHRIDDLKKIQEQEDVFKLANVEAIKSMGKSVEGLTDKISNSFGDLKDHVTAQNELTRQLINIKADEKKSI